MSILVRKYLGKSRYVEELVEDWHIAHQQAMLSWDLQELVGECVEHARLTEKTCESLLDQLYEEKVRDLDGTGESMTIALAKTLRVFSKVEGLVARFVAQSHPEIDNVREFENAIRQTQITTERFRENWPALDQQMVEDSLAAYRRGEYQSIRELLDESALSCRSQLAPPFEASPFPEKSC